MKADVSSLLRVVSAESGEPGELTGSRSVGPGSSHILGLSSALGCAQRFCQSIALIIRLSWSWFSGVQTPLGQQRLRNLLWLAELEDTGLLGYNGALMFRRQTRHQLGHVSAGLLRVEITHLFWNINKRCENLVMALLLSLLQSTPSSTDLHRQLLTAGVSYKLARLLLNILGAAAALIHCPALLRSLTIAHLLHRFVTLLNCFIECFLLECDLTQLLKVLLTHLLLSWLKLGDIGVVTLLCVLVGALQDGLLLQTGDSLLLVNTTEPCVWISDTVAEVNTSCH